MPRLRLPPLPPARTWSAYFPRTLNSSGSGHERDYNRRVAVVNRDLADEMVKSLKLRPAEVVIEAFAGVGSLTRALIQGGKRDKDDELSRKTEWWEQVGQHSTQRVANSTAGKGVRVAQEYPMWSSQFSPEKREEGTKQEHQITSYHEGATIHVPKVVVATDPAPGYLIRALGMDEAAIPAKASPPQVDQTQKQAEWTAKSVPKTKMILKKSEYEDNLVLGYADLYEWETLGHILSNPLVNPHIPRLSSVDDSSPESAKRKWSDPPPPITVIANMPQAVIGDQLCVQWIHSVIGAAEGKPAWMWDWGRIRLALFTERAVYDRINARPGEGVFCRLTIMARALWHLEPLAPYHHVVNIDKGGARTEHAPLTLTGGQSSAIAKQQHESYGPFDTIPRTTTYPLDFFPTPNRTSILGAGNSVPLKRTPILGTMLTPRLDSPINVNNREEWDYVLRHIFVRRSSKLSSAIPCLGFNAGSLMKLVEGDGDFKGRPVPGDTVVKDLDVEDWERVVDVFQKWPFKPTNLLSETSIIDEDD